MMGRMPSGKVTPFQSTHPSGVRLSPYVCEARVNTISIHAPQWGATIRAMVVCPDIQISIHAPQWGATRGWRCPFERCRDFNPRTPVGCDRANGRRNTKRSYCNPRTPVGGDSLAYCQSRSAHQFQSSHPSGVGPRFGGRHFADLLISIHAPQWGATPRYHLTVVPIIDFNPRTPVGCDWTSCMTSSCR